VTFRTFTTPTTLPSSIRPVHRAVSGFLASVRDLLPAGLSLLLLHS